MGSRGALRYHLRRNAYWNSSSRHRPCFARVGLWVYRVGQRGSFGDLKRVAIPTFQNSSYEAGYGFELTESFLEEFYRRGSLTVVRDPEQADLVLSGHVLSIRTSSTSFSSAGLALEQGVRVEVDLSAVLADGSTVALFPGSLLESDHYLESADLEVAKKNREDALRKIASALAGRTYDALQEHFGK